jgi:beta-galactosidase GanA
LIADQSAPFAEQRGRKNMKKFVIAAILAAWGAGFAAQAQLKEHPIPRLVKSDGRYALLVDGAPYLMLGAQANNSSDWPATLPKVWSAIEFLHANTLEIPIYWEQFEPKQGQFDYTEMDTVLAQARAHHVHLVLLWFGTWKNGSQHYMPEWMKLQPGRYFHVINKDGELIDSPSPFCMASLDADTRAFTAFMRHLKATDSERTVLMVQVENETGTWGALRDYSPEANRLFDGPVPAEVLKAMGKTADSSSANWKDVFGPEAEVNFHAWAVSRYVEKVAAAGKAVYPLPLYVNAALRDPLKPGAPGTYESGGPTDNVLSIWKAEAPSIDILAPDIYLPGTAEYLKVLDLYHRPDNALFVPETSGAARAARFLFSALGLQAIGYSPFGLDYTRVRRAPADKPDAQNAFLEPTAQNYRLIGPMMREVAKLNFEGKLQAVAEVEGQDTQTLHFGDWDAVVSYGATRNGQAKGNREPIGRALVAQLEDNQFLVAGYDCRVDFRPAGTEQQRKSGQIVIGSGQIPSVQIDGKWQHRQFLRVEEGAYEDGVFKFQRILNGDQTDWGLNFGSEPDVLRVSVATY